MSRKKRHWQIPLHAVCSSLVPCGAFSSRKHSYWIHKHSIFCTNIAVVVVLSFDHMFKWVQLGSEAIYTGAKTSDSMTFRPLKCWATYTNIASLCPKNCPEKSHLLFGKIRCLNESMNLISYLAILIMIVDHQLMYEVTHFILPLKLPSSDMLWYVAPTQKLPPFPCEFRCSVNARPFAICECFSRLRPAGRQRSEVERCLDLLIRFEGMCHGWIVLKSFEINQMFKQVDMHINHINIQQIVSTHGNLYKYHQKNQILCCFKCHSFKGAAFVHWLQGVVTFATTVEFFRLELDFPQAIPKNTGTIFAPVQWESRSWLCFPIRQRWSQSCCPLGDLPKDFFLKVPVKLLHKLLYAQVSRLR